LLNSRVASFLAACGSIATNPDVAREFRLNAFPLKVCLPRSVFGPVNLTAFPFGPPQQLLWSRFLDF
jgi:hypothetical protein